ncbi:MAG: transglutaminaseTgpA domain-containing protein [Anaerolineaceae bacterium]|nr:transglutaminaseTgpA domain-containing protein [Anaerolineaceae bacterium]
MSAGPGQSTSAPSWLRQRSHETRRMLAAAEPATLLILTLLLLTPLLSLRAAGWPLSMDTAVPVLLLSLLFSLWLALSRHSELFALLLSWLYGFSSALLLVAANEPGDLFQGIASLLQRVVLWVNAALAGSFSQDAVILNLLLAAVIWLLTYNAVWHVYRINQVLRAVLPVGLALLANAFSYQGATNLDPFLGAFLFLSLLLVIRSSLEGREWQWYVNRVRVPRNLRRQFYQLGGLLALLALLLAWLLPATNLQQRLDQLEELLAGEPLTEAANLLDRLFSSGDLPGPATADYYGGDSLQLGGAVRLGDDVVMQVAAPPEHRYYWRSRVFDIYENGRWLPAADTRLTDPQAPLELPPVGAADETRVAIDQTFTMALRASRLVYAAPQVAAVNLPTRSDIRYIGPDGRFLEPPARDQQIRSINVSVIRPLRVLYSGDSYTVTSLLNTASADQLRPAGRDWPDWVRSLYFYVSPSVTARTRELALNIVNSAGAETPYDQAVALESWLRQNIRYNELIPSPPEGQDPVDWLLFDIGEGYCNYYASAMIVMLRSLGVPARLATGFAQGRWDAAGSHYEVLERDAHSWVEVYFPGYGWVEFEPTSAQAPLNREDPEQSLVPAESTLPTATATATATPTPDERQDFPSPEPEREVLPERPDLTPTSTPTPTPTSTPSPTFTPSPTATPSPTHDLPSVPPQSAPPLDSPLDSPQSDPPEAPSSVPPLPNGLLAAMFLLLLLLLLLFLWWWWEWRGLRRMNPIARAWARLERYTHLLGIRMDPAQTPAERRRRIVEDLPVAEAPVTAITSLYMRARYGPASQADADSNEADISWGRARYRILRRWLGRVLLPWRGR